MGVYIPNMEKPKGCWLCIFQIVDLEGGANGCVLDHSIQSADWNEDTVDDCPLIEIDLKRDIPTIWYNRQTGQYEPKDTKQEVYERLYKLKNGERRTDEVLER